MHYHLEIVMPPTDDVEKRIAEVMQPFDENFTEEEDEEGYRYNNPNSFWDWYVIGGRWAGIHLQTLVDPERLSEFNEELTKREVTVSGVVCGKQTLQPASQIAMVDELWREYFPDSELKACPLFSHFASNYEDNCLDVDSFNTIGKHLTASHLIIAGLDYKDEKYEAKHMLQDEVWNGCTHLETTWDGNIITGVEMCMDKMKSYRDDFREKNTVNDDWLVATVDYHS